MFKFLALANSPPERQWAKRVFRRMTKCHSVPSEGCTLQCDVRTTHGVGRGWINRYSCFVPFPVSSYPPPPSLRSSSPCLSGTVCWRGIVLIFRARPHRVFIRRPSCEAASGHRVKSATIRYIVFNPRVVNKKLLAFLCVFA